MARLADWEARLRNLVAEAADRSFMLGTWDCALFAGAVVEAVTGFDIAAPYRGKYTTETGYMKALRRRKHSDIFGPFDKLTPRAGVMVCGCGDVVSDGDAVGLMWRGCALFLGEISGFERVPLHKLQFGWKL